MENYLRHSSWEGVRRLVSEHVAHVRTRDNFEDASALPHLNPIEYVIKLLLLIQATIFIMIKFAMSFLPSGLNVKVKKFT